MPLEVTASNMEAALETIDGFDAENKEDVAQPQQNHMTPVPQPGQQQNNELRQQALQQLLHTLKSPHSPEQQKQVLTILKSNPQLMAAFIKQRSEHQQRMQLMQQQQQQPGQQQIPQQRNNVPQQALRQLLQTLKLPHSPQQQKQVLTILKSNPQLMAAFIKQRSEHQQRMQLMQQQQQQPGQQPQPGQQQIPQQRNNVPQRALRQLLQTLKSPHSPQQRKQVLTILKSNPQLMAAFIKQRSEHLQRMQLMQQQQQQHRQLQQGNMQAADRQPVPG